MGSRSCAFRSVVRAASELASNAEPLAGDAELRAIGRAKALLVQIATFDRGSIGLACQFSVGNVHLADRHR